MSKKTYIFREGPLNGAVIDFEGEPWDFIYCSGPQIKRGDAGGSVSYTLWWNCKMPTESRFVYQFKNGAYVLKIGQP